MISPKLRHETTHPVNKKLSNIVTWLNKHHFRVVSTERKEGSRKWAEGGKWDDLVQDAISIGGNYHTVDLISFKQYEIVGKNFTIQKQGENHVFLHYTSKESEDFNRRIGLEDF